MRRILIIFYLFFLTLSACTKTPETPVLIEVPKKQLYQQETAPEAIPELQPPTWEEQYDLGLRYLSEGKYEEAIIAFTAAIKIDPKRAPAFVGRGDSYFELTKPETDLTFYDSAEKDYQTALELDDQVVDVYVKLSEVYLAIDERIKAVEILQKGLDNTGDESLKERIEELQKELAGGTFIGIPIGNADVDVYHQQWEAYMGQYPTEEGYPGHIAFLSYGIRFPTPAQVIVKDASGESIEAEIYEAGLVGNFDGEQIQTEDGKPGPLAEKEVVLTGYFTDEHHKELELNENTELPDKYLYYPNGPYIFCVETMREIKIDEIIDKPSDDE